MKEEEKLRKYFQDWFDQHNVYDAIMDLYEDIWIDSFFINIHPYVERRIVLYDPNFGSLAQSEEQVSLKDKVVGA